MILGVPSKRLLYDFLIYVALASVGPSVPAGKDSPAFRVQVGGILNWYERRIYGKKEVRSFFFFKFSGEGHQNMPTLPTYIF